MDEFSPKKATNCTDELRDMMERTSVFINGKLQLNYVTPTQQKAVEEFLFGDPNIEKVFLKLIIDFLLNFCQIGA